jgi:hypothetical protein
MTDGPDTPQTPARDDNDNEDFGPTEAVGQGGYPEESPAETQPEGEPQKGREEQEQRDEG